MRRACISTFLSSFIAIGLIAVTPTVAAAPSADLSASLEPLPKHFVEGRKIRFLLVVANAGPEAADGVVVHGGVPAGTRRVIGRVEGARPCQVANPNRATTGKGKRKRALTCGLGTIAPGARVKLTVVVRTATALRVRAQAQVHGPVADPNTSNDRARTVALAKPFG